MGSNNGQRFGPRNRDRKPAKTDERIVYGATCTWWGPVQAAHHKGMIRVDGREKWYSGAEGPICPECAGSLLQVPNEEAFWKAVGWFEEGAHGVTRPHPGYTDFMKWMRRRCFRDIIIATVAYKSQTGVDIVLDPADFSLSGEPEQPDDGEAHAEICELED